MSPEETESFSDQVVDHYEDPYHCGPLEHATHTANGTIPICGDVICVELRINQDSIIEEVWFQGEGCMLMQAAASMLMEQAEGRTLDEFRAFSATDMLDLVGKPLIANRQKCCLLAWRVMQDAVTTAVDQDLEDDLHFGGPSLGEES